MGLRGPPDFVVSRSVMIGDDRCFGILGTFRSGREGRLTPELSRRRSGGRGGAALAEPPRPSKSRDTTPGASLVGFSDLLGGPPDSPYVSFHLCSEMARFLA